MLTKGGGEREGEIKRGGDTWREKEKERQRKIKRERQMERENEGDKV